MNLTIEWSPRASSEYETLIDYLIVHFGITVASRFDSHVEEVLELIILNRSREKVFIVAFLLNKHLYTIELILTKLNWSPFGIIEEILRNLSYEPQRDSNP